MKAGTLFLVTYALMANAQPHGHQHAHFHQQVARTTEVEARDPVVLNDVVEDVADLDKRHFKKHHHGSNFGLSYDPNNDDGTYKTTAQITADFQRFKSAGYSHVRSYRTDWDQVAHMLDAAQASGLKLFPSTSVVTDIDTEIPCIINAAKGRWDLVDAIGVGNEDVNSGTASADQVLQAVTQARQMLRGAGYQGPVVHAETFNQILADTRLCHAGEFVAANCHAFFDPNTDAAGAADFVMTQHDNVKKACGGKWTRITESGWPSAGDAIGAAVPSPENQATVINGLKSKFANRHFTMFMAYNAPYKAKDSGDPTEAYWGIL